MGFPNTINYSYAPGFPGGLASPNPTRTLITGVDILRAASSGLKIGAFAWIEADGVTVSNVQPSDSTSTPPAGFVVRDQNALITNYLDESTMTLPAGFAVTLMNGGDFFAVASTSATTGQAVYASTTNGTLYTAASGSAPSGTIATGWVVSQGGSAGSILIITGPLAPPVTSSSSSDSTSSSSSSSSS